MDSEQSLWKATNGLETTAKEQLQRGQEEHCESRMAYHRHEEKRPPQQQPKQNGPLVVHRARETCQMNVEETRERRGGGGDGRGRCRCSGTHSANTGLGARQHRKGVNKQTVHVVHHTTGYLQRGLPYDAKNSASVCITRPRNYTSMCTTQTQIQIDTPRKNKQAKTSAATNTNTIGPREA